MVNLANKTLYILFALIFVPGILASYYYINSVNQTIQPSCGTITFDKLPGDPHDAQNVTSPSFPYLTLLDKATTAFAQGKSSYSSPICGDYTQGVLDVYYRGYYIRVTIKGG